MQQTKNPEIEEEARECLKIIAIAERLARNGRRGYDRLGDFYTNDFTDRGRKIRELPDLVPVYARHNDRLQYKAASLLSAAGRVAEIEYLRLGLNGELRGLGLDDIEEALDGLEASMVELIVRLAQVYQGEEGGNQ